MVISGFVIFTLNCFASQLILVQIFYSWFESHILCVLVVSLLGVVIKYHCIYIGIETDSKYLNDLPFEIETF